MNEWISTEERLPQDDSPVLVWHDDYELVDLAYWNKDNWLNCDFFDLRKNFYDPKQITHWMPLPQPPKFQIREQL